MQIQSGKLYENRTWKYLYPCLKSYGTDLTRWLANFLKLAVGVGDSNREDESNCMYILIDTNISLGTEKKIQDYKDKFATFLDWLSYQNFYVTDYIYEKDMHMVVVKLPKKHNSSYIDFVKGNYSSMYNLSEIREYFKYVSISNKEIELKQNLKLKNIKAILKKDSGYVETFVKDVNNRFKTTATVEDFRDAELDYPPAKKEEIFNYKEVLKEVL